MKLQQKSINTMARTAHPPSSEETLSTMIERNSFSTFTGVFSRKMVDFISEPSPPCPKASLSSRQSLPRSCLLFRSFTTTVWGKGTPLNLKFLKTPRLRPFTCLLPKSLTKFGPLITQSVGFRATHPRRRCSIPQQRTDCIIREESILSLQNPGPGASLWDST